MWWLDVVGWVDGIWCLLIFACAVNEYYKYLMMYSDKRNKIFLAFSIGNKIRKRSDSVRIDKSIF